MLKSKCQAVDMRWSIPSLLAIALLSSAEASAQIVIAPPILGKEIKPPASAVERAIQEELEEMGIVPMKRTKRTTARLAKCGNKMSCLAGIGKQIGVTHVLHVIVAQRDDEVLAQLTILDVHTRRPLDVARSKTMASSDAIDNTIRGATRTVGLTLAKLPEFADDSIRMDEMKGSAPKGPERPRGPYADEPAEDDGDDTVAGLPPLDAPPEAPKPRAQPPRETRDEPAETFGPASKPKVAPPAKREPSPYDPTTVTAPGGGKDDGPNYLVYTAGGLGIAAGIAGSVALIMARSDASARDETPQVNVDERQSLHDSALGKQTAGIIMLVGAGVALGAAGIIALLEDEEPDPMMMGGAFRATSDGFVISF